MLISFSPVNGEKHGSVGPRKMQGIFPIELYSVLRVVDPTEFSDTSCCEFCVKSTTSIKVNSDITCRIYLWEVSLSRDSGDHVLLCILLLPVPGARDLYD